MSTDKKNDKFDPERHKDIDKGPIKKEHKNQYGEKPNDKDRDLAGRAKAEEKRHKNK